MNKKVGFISLGCAKNLTDTQTMIKKVIDAGFSLSSDASQSEIIVINTCAFIDSAKEEAISTILEMAKYKNDKCELLIVTGCLSQRYKDEVLKEFPEIDIILGTTSYDEIANEIKNFYNHGKRISNVKDENHNVPSDLERYQTTPFYTSYIKIADGCDNFCTYCIIPKLRGKYRSRDFESIITEAKSLAKNGVKELILVAQDTACYGKDLQGNITLATLLKELAKIDGLKWIRLQYLYPENITDELIDEISQNDKVVKYVDMPIQHISDNILKKMGRKTSQKNIETLITKLRERIPDITIRTSLITGFPTETDKDHELLKEFLKKYKLDKVGVFTYSKEEGTSAAKFSGQISEDIKEKRYADLMTIQNKVSLEINKSKISKKCTVIVEGYDENEFSYIGRCSFDSPDVDALAYIYSEVELFSGDIVECEIIDFSDYDVSVKVII